MDKPQEFFAAYDESDELCMTLQGAVKFQEYFRCYVIDQEKVYVMRYDPGQPHHLRYVPGNPPPSPALDERMVGDALKLCRALGYDLNTVEFAVEDGVPYAIDFMNPAPGCRPGIGGAGEFPVDRGRGGGHGYRQGARAGRAPLEYRWAKFLGWRRLQLVAGISAGDNYERSTDLKPSLNIGIEEEYQTIDPVTRDLRSHIHAEIIAKGQD